AVVLGQLPCPEVHGSRVASDRAGLDVPVGERVPVAQRDPVVVVEHDLRVQVEVAVGLDAEVERAVAGGVRGAELVVEPIVDRMPQLDARAGYWGHGPAVVADPLARDVEVDGRVGGRGRYG